MTIAFFSVVLNHHQVLFADELFRILGNAFVFVETIKLHDVKGSEEDFTQRPYLLQAWKSDEARQKAEAVAKDFDVCLFDGCFHYQKLRLKGEKLTFEISERWLKQGWLNLLSPRLCQNIMTHHRLGWKAKPLYKLCASAFAAKDQMKLGTFRDRCFKWGYFTNVNADGLNAQTAVASEPLRLMWVARFIPWKHPEMIVKLAYRLKYRGYKFHIDMYGDGVLLNKIALQMEAQELVDVITLHGSVPNDEVRRAMREHDALLFTSNRQEGWGAVVNEAMSEGCVVVGSDAIGSVPYLIEDGVNGLQFRSGSVTSLFERVVWLTEHRDELAAMRQRALDTMRLWSPENAARSLLQLIDDLQNGRECSVKEGPCSKA